MHIQLPFATSPGRSISDCIQQSSRMQPLLFAVLLFGTVASCQACSCMESHPQENYCRAHFVVRAKVLSQELIQDNFTRVFNIRILKTYKGGLALNQTEAIRPYGSNLRTLFARAYTASYDSLCGVELVNDTVYLLSGSIWRGKLQVNLCGWYQPWSEITPRQRAGIRRFYGENCDCQISPCYAEHCEKLKGCVRQSGVHFGDCEWDHSYCVKNAEGTACSWRETSEFKNCKSQVVP